MTCSDFIEEFTGYVDGVAPEEVRREAGEHVRNCADCRRYLTVFERGRELLRSFPEVEVSDDFHPRLQHRIYHIEDGEVIRPGGATGSATTAMTALGMAVLLVMAAWSPVWISREAEVDLRPIVVSRPAQRALGLRALPSSVLPRDADFLTGEPFADWGSPGALLYRYSPLAERAGRARLRRAGLD